MAILIGRQGNRFFTAPVEHDLGVVLVERRRTAVEVHLVPDEEHLERVKPPIPRLVVIPRRSHG